MRNAEYQKRKYQRAYQAKPQVSQLDRSGLLIRRSWVRSAPGPLRMSCHCLVFTAARPFDGNKVADNNLILNRTMFNRHCLPAWEKPTGCGKSQSIALHRTSV